MCTSLSYHNATSKPGAPNFPFTGPVQLSVTLSKQDLPEGYKFDGRLIKVFH